MIINKFIYIHELCLGHPVFLLFFTGLPSNTTFLLSAQKDISTCPPPPKQNQGKVSFLLPTLVQAPSLHNPRSSSPSLKPLCCNCFPYSCLLTSGRLSFYNFNTWIELHLFSWHPSFQPSLPNCSVLAGTPCSLPRTGPSRYQILEPASQSIISSSHHKLSDSYGVCGFVPVMALDF